MATHTTTVIPSTNDMVASGNAIAVAFACDDNGNPGTTATCADSRGNSYAAGQSVQVSATGSAAGVRTALFVALNATPLTGTDTITITHGAVVASAAWASEFSGVATSSALDVSSSKVQTAAQGGGSPDSGTTGSASQANIIWIGAAGFEAVASGLGTNRLNVDGEARLVGTSGGGGASNISVNLQYEVVNVTTGRASGNVGGSSADTACVIGAYKAITGGTSAGDPKIMVNGTETSIVLTTANAMHTKCNETSTYPTNIGMRSSGTTADTYMYECGVLVAYDATPQVLFRQRRPVEIRV